MIFCAANLLCYDFTADRRTRISYHVQCMGVCTYVCEYECVFICMAACARAPTINTYILVTCLITKIVLTWSNILYNLLRGPSK